MKLRRVSFWGIMAASLLVGVRRRDPLPDEPLPVLEEPLQAVRGRPLGFQILPQRLLRRHALLQGESPEAGARLPGHLRRDGGDEVGLAQGAAYLGLLEEGLRAGRQLHEAADFPDSDIEW